MTDVTNILTIIIQLVLVLLVTFTIPWIKSKVSEDNINKAKSLVKLAVQAAEMIFGAGTGAEKKEYVMKYIYQQFEKIGLTFDEDTVNNMIESAVLELDKKL